MKKKAVIIILIILSTIGAVILPIYMRSRAKEYDPNEGKTMVWKESITSCGGHTIVYSRYGLEKGIYSLSLKTGEKRCIIGGELENVNMNSGMLSFTSNILLDGQLAEEAYSSQNKHVSGSNLYCCFLPGQTPVKSIAVNLRLKNRASINLDNTAAVYVTENSDGCDELYCNYIRQGESKSIGITSSSILDACFINTTTIMYSRIVTEKDDSYYQIFTYSLDTKEEKKLYCSDNSDVNAVVSPNGKYVAYLSLINNGYSPCIITLSGNKAKDHKKINEDIVLGGTLKWSPDSRYIMYTAVNYSSPEVYSIKLVDMLLCKTESISPGYIGAFSPDSSNIVIASYKDEEGSKKQVISIADINEKNLHNLISLKESGCYARSIGILEWLE